MAKPTLLQTILGRPSQTYSFPEEKVYFSTKQDMVKIATEPHSIQTVVLDHKSQDSIIDNTAAIAPAQKPFIAENDTHELDSDSDHGDVFYTPNTSPRTSMASSLATPLKPRIPSTTTPTARVEANLSTTTLSSTSLDGHSLFSFSTADSTRITTPHDSDSGHRPVHIKPTPTPRPPQDSHGYVNQEWAKDVRWLVPSDANSKSTTTPAPRRRNTQSESSPHPSPMRAKPNTPITKSIDKATPSIMASMATLLEEDEFQNPSFYHPRSSVLISRPKRQLNNTRGRMASSPTPPLPPPSTSTVRSPKNPSQPLQRRRSRSLGHISAPQSQASSSSSHATSMPGSSHTRMSKTSKYASSSADPYDAATTSLPTFTPGDLPSQGTRGYTSLVLPRAPVPFSQASTSPRLGLGKDSGYFTGGGGMSTDGKVDLTKSGIAQTTMASVEVIYGLSRSSGSGSPGKKIMGLFRRGSSSSSTHSPSPSGPSSAFRMNPKPRMSTGDDVENKHSVDTGHVETPLGFTSYRKPPNYVPSGAVLVQVWGAAVDGVDNRLVFGGGSEKLKASTKGGLADEGTSPGPATPKRSVSLRSTLGRFGGTQAQALPPPSASGNSPRTTSTPSGTNTASSIPTAGVGYIPGRSFVGRILECGWEVGEEVGRRGDWVVGLLDLRKCGALTEFIIVDRHRVHRVPYPRMEPGGLFEPLNTHETKEVNEDPGGIGAIWPNNMPGPSRSSSFRRTPNTSPLPTPSLSRGASMRSNRPQNRGSPSLDSGSVRRPAHSLPLTLEELALIPICGIPAYRAVRTFAFAFSGVKSPGGAEGSSNFGSVDSNGLDSWKGKGKGKELNRDHERDRHYGERRRALVLRGHDGAGAMAVQMLVKKGWRVCVHVPYRCLQYEGEEFDDKREGEGREEYCMRIVEERIRSWGGEEVIFDDGEEVNGDSGRGAVIRVIERLCEDGDIFDGVLDTIGGKEVWEASERLLKLSSGECNEKEAEYTNGNGKGTRTKTKVKQFTTLVGDSPGRVVPSAGDNFKAGLRSLSFGVGGRGEKQENGKVGYAWVNAVQDVDWEGEDVGETIGAILRTVLEDGIRPWVGQGGRVVPFEKTPEVFVGGSRGMLADGGTVVIKVAG